MSVAFAETSNPDDTYPAGFAALDEIYTQHPVSAQDIDRFGKYVLVPGSAVVLDTPHDIQRPDEPTRVLTNTSQILKITSERGGIGPDHDIFFGRNERGMHHLGSTIADPRRITISKTGAVSHQAYPDAMAFEGEDARAVWGVKRRSGTGRIHTGWLVSTVIATPKPGNPADVEKIEQVFRWGTTLREKDMEEIWRIPGLKNTNVVPTDDPNDTSLHAFMRPNPDITYAHVQNLEEITPDLANISLNLTKDFLSEMPDGIHVHTGVNTAIALPGHPGFIKLHSHEAYAPMVDGKKELHYRLADYGFELPTRLLPTGRFILLGVTATRDMFDWAEPKQPENGVGDYYDVTYGTPGHTSTVGETVPVLTGLSDSQIGYLKLKRVA